MNKLIVINYEGIRFKMGNEENCRLNFFKDSGLYPSEILDQISIEEFFNFFMNYSYRSEKLIIHIKSHGFIKGICQLHSDTIDDPICDTNTIISWEDLVSLFNLISNNCNDLIINMGTICRSIHIKDCKQKMNFHTLVTTKSVSDTVEPRKLNKLLISDIDNFYVDNGYELLRRQNTPPPLN